MKLRGTRGGISLLLEPHDTQLAIERTLADKGRLLNGKVRLELSESSTPWGLIATVSALVTAQGGHIDSVTSPGSHTPPAMTPLPRAQTNREKGKTVIIARTVRSGGRVESQGSIVVLGDVNAGAELLADDDIIVVGALRGIAHAGRDGNNSNAVVWARQIISPQIRIADAVAQHELGSNDAAEAEVAYLEQGRIILRAFE